MTNDVKDALDELRPGLAGMKVDSSMFRPADYIEKAIDNLTLAVILACLLLALVLFAFLFEWRTALICFAAFAVSIAAAALVLSRDRVDVQRARVRRPRGGGRASWSTTR